MYPRYAYAAVGCVVVKGNEICLVKRGYPPSQGLWSIPGGVVEPQEMLYEAAERELFEETGLKAKPLGVVAVTDVLRRELDRVIYRYVIIDILFDEKTITGDLRAGGDAVDARWFSFEEVLSRSDVTSSTKKLVDIMKKGVFKIMDTVIS